MCVNGVHGTVVLERVVSVCLTVTFNTPFVKTVGLVLLVSEKEDLDIRCLLRFPQSSPTTFLVTCILVYEITCPDRDGVRLSSKKSTLSVGEGSRSSKETTL